MKDEDESFNLQRDLVEYHAAFIEPESVSKVRSSRTGTDSENNKKDANFADTVEQLFGKKLDIPGAQSPDMELNEVEDLLDRVTEYQNYQESMKEKTKFNFAHWTDISLE